MKELSVELRETSWSNAKEAQRNPVEISEDLLYIDKETIVQSAGGPVLWYKPSVFDPSKYLTAMNAAEPQGGPPKIDHRTGRGGIPSGRMRQSGIEVPSTTYGYVQAAPTRHRLVAAPNKSNKTQRHTYNALLHLLQSLDPIYSNDQFPFGDHDNQVASCWKLLGTPFTSLIHNFPAAAYPYHRDSGNVKGSWSMMPVIRGEHSSGGCLVLPELGVAVECASGSVTSFSGTQFYHGVTTVIGSRWSIVYYAKSGLITAADSPALELIEGNKRRTEYEQKGPK